MEYQLRAIERELSFVITLVDAFASTYVHKNTQVLIEGPHKKPLTKEEGHFVFFDLPQGDYEVIINSEGFFAETVIASTGGNQYTIMLIPNRRYKLGGTTWIEGFLKPNINIYAAPDAKEIKLIRAEGDIIHIMTQMPWDLTRKHISIGEDRKIYFVEGRLGKFSYRVSEPVLKHHTKNDIVVPTSLGRTDAKGYILCPVANFIRNHREILIWWIEDDCMISNKVEAIYGQGTAIKQLC